MNIVIAGMNSDSLITSGIDYGYTLKRWSGAAWVDEPLKRYTGAEWGTAVLKVYTGTEWMPVDVSG